jgi:hypothetical protein
MGMTHPVLLTFWGVGAFMMLPLIVDAFKGGSFRPWTKWLGIPGLAVLLFAASITFVPHKMTWVLMAEDKAGNNLEGERLVEKGEDLESLEDCRSRCAAEARCEAYTFTVYPNDRKHCILLTEANQAGRPLKGTSSGRKRSWAQPVG